MNSSTNKHEEGNKMNEHLSALMVRLSNERVRLSNAKNKKEIELRKVWIAQIEKEIKFEQKLSKIEEVEMTDDELLAELYE